MTLSHDDSNIFYIVLDIIIMKGQLFDIYAVSDFYLLKK